MVEWISGRIICSNEIELHAQNMITVLSLVVNIIEERGGYMII